MAIIKKKDLKDALVVQALLVSTALEQAEDSESAVKAQRKAERKLEEFSVLANQQIEELQDLLREAEEDGKDAQEEKEYLGQKVSELNSELFEYQREREALRQTIRTLTNENKDLKQRLEDTDSKEGSETY